VVDLLRHSVTALGALLSPRQREDIKGCAGAADPDVRVSGGIRLYLGVGTQLAPDDRHILPAVGSGVADWRASEVAACSERPDDLSIAGVECAEHAFIGTALEKHVARGGHHGRVVGDLPRNAPHGFSSYRIVGLKFPRRLGSRS